MKVKETDKETVQFYRLQKDDCFRVESRPNAVFIKTHMFYIQLPDSSLSPTISCNAVNLVTGNFENFDAHVEVYFCSDATVLI